MKKKSLAKQELQRSSETQVYSTSFPQNTKANQISQPQKNFPEYNPFIMPLWRIKTEQTINGLHFLSYTNLSLSSIRKKQSPKMKTETLETKSSLKEINKNKKDHGRQIQSDQEIVTCVFCAQKSFVSKIGQHLKICLQAVFCNNCQQYILKNQQESHLFSCIKNNKKIQNQVGRNYIPAQEINKAERLDNEKKIPPPIKVAVQTDKQFDIKSQRYKKQLNKNTHKPCLICNLEFQQREKISQTACQHQFHKDCLKDWIQVKQKCPVCNQSLLKT